jgi:predicted alpha/beta hydrolase family esterase
VNPAFILIHSPVVGPTTWSPVMRELQRRGRAATVPSLLGIADAPSPHWRHGAEALQAAAERIAQPVVLVGHSGAGPLLPVMADALTGDVAALVFVDAFLPPSRGGAPLAPLAVMGHLRALATISSSVATLTEPAPPTPAAAAGRSERSRAPGTWRW